MASSGLAHSTALQSQHALLLACSLYCRRMIAKPLAKVLGKQYTDSQSCDVTLVLAFEHLASRPELSVVAEGEFDEGQAGGSCWQRVRLVEGGGQFGTRCAPGCAFVWCIKAKNVFVYSLHAHCPADCMRMRLRRSGMEQRGRGRGQQGQGYGGRSQQGPSAAMPDTPASLQGTDVTEPAGSVPSQLQGAGGAQSAGSLPSQQTQGTGDVHEPAPASQQTGRTQVIANEQTGSHCMLTHNNSSLWALCMSRP